MYQNIGNKIKTLVKVVTWLGTIACCIIGFYFMSEDEAGIGFGILLGGSLAIWISGFVMYGFGQLVDNSDKLVKALVKTEASAPTAAVKEAPKAPVQPEKTEPTPAQKSSCPNCGAHVAPGNAFCTSCGTKL